MLSAKDGMKIGMIWTSIRLPYFKISSLIFTTRCKVFVSMSSCQTARRGDSERLCMKDFSDVLCVREKEPQLTISLVSMTLSFINNKIVSKH